MKMYTRKQMMNGEVSFNKYMDQFVTEGMVQTVFIAIGVERIKNSSDKHLNDIPLREWDSLTYSMKNEIALDAKLWRDLHNSDTITSLSDRRRWVDVNPKGFLFSKSDGVCLAKAAARRLLIETTK